MPVEPFLLLGEGICIHDLFSIHLRGGEEGQGLPVEALAGFSFEMLLGSLMLVKVLGDSRDGDLYLEVPLQPVVEAFGAEA